MPVGMINIELWQRDVDVKLMVDAMKNNSQPFRRTLKVVEAYSAPGDSKVKSFIKEFIELLRIGEEEDFVDSMQNHFK